jgi:hypothetical protein
MEVAGDKLDQAKEILYPLLLRIEKENPDAFGR